MADKGVGGGGGGGSVDPLKKGNLWQIFLEDNVEWSSKNLWKMMSADVKASIKQQEIKDLVAHLTNVYTRITFKTWNTM